MADSTKFAAEVNWPLVAGLGVLGAVVFYGFYIINGQLQAVDPLIQQIQQTAQNVTDDVQSLTSPFTAVSDWISGLFSSSNGGATDGG